MSAVTLKRSIGVLQEQYNKCQKLMTGQSILSLESIESTVGFNSTHRVKTGGRNGGLLAAHEKMFGEETSFCSFGSF
jgi:hypothetical protein